jgi:hypothetical protein
MDNYMIEMVDICKSFGNLKANDNITLKLKKGAQLQHNSNYVVLTSSFGGARIEGAGGDGAIHHFLFI